MTSQDTRRCSCCLLVLPHTEEHYYRRSADRGFGTICKECTKKRARAASKRFHAVPVAERPKQSCGGFFVGDYVKTPTGRLARLVSVRRCGMRFDARYLGGPQEETILDPRALKLADNPHLVPV